jgi:sirohydrochlorin cobaltochelatase
MTNETAVMVCGHGSRDPEAITEFEAIAAGLRERLKNYDVDYGFLEFAKPVIRSGLDRLRERGAKRIVALPGMLFAAGHAKNDIPSVLNRYQAEHDDVDIDYCRELGLDAKLIQAAGDRISMTLSAADSDTPKEETLLVVVGRGSSDSDANSNVSKLTRMLWEGLGLGWAETAYSGVTFPLVEPALEHATKLGYRRIIVFPYFLFTGVLVKRIYHYTDMVASRHPDIEFLKAPYLNDHPLVFDAFADRVGEVFDGANLMNCKLCKYREQILGFEDEVGLAQQSHHHHVEGIGTGEGHSNDHNDKTAHGHSHHHPHPHADHPLGPQSMKTTNQSDS